MRDIKIKTTLGITPIKSCYNYNCNKVVITKGATASINYDLTEKVYTFNDIVQATFSFKYNKDIFWYTMVEYFTETLDKVADGETTYYERMQAPEQSISKYIFIPKSCAKGDLVEGLFVLTILEDTETTENWQLDKHFYYCDTEGYKAINFILSSEETRALPTTGEDFLDFEVAIKLDTDTLAGMHSKDSIIIEPQTPIMVVESIFQNIN